MLSLESTPLVKLTIFCKFISTLSSGTDNSFNLFSYTPISKSVIVVWSPVLLSTYNFVTASLSSTGVSKLTIFCEFISNGIEPTINLSDSATNFESALLTFYIVSC